MRAWWTALLFVVACSKSDSGDKNKPAELPKESAGGSGTAATGSGGSAAAGSAVGSGSAVGETQRPPLPKLDVPARLEEVGTKFDDSLALATKSGSQAAKDKCADLEPLYQPFCSSGMAAAFLSKKGAAAKDFEPTMTKLDPAFVPVHCQSLGFAVEDSPKLAAIAKDLATDTCRASFWDGHGFFRALSAAGAPTGVCRTEEGKAPDADACAKQAEALAKADLPATSCDAKKGRIPAGMEAACAHGVGRSLVFMMNADAKHAIAACASKTPALADACISGVGFVMTFPMPDRTDVAFDVMAGLETRTKAAFARGVGRALATWKHGDAKNLSNWLGALSSSERREADRLADLHDKCASYYDLDKCEWQPK